MKLIDEETRTNKCEFCGEKSIDFVENIYYNYQDKSWNVQIFELCKKHANFLIRRIRRRNRRFNYKIELIEIGNELIISWKCIE